MKLPQVKRFKWNYLLLAFLLPLLGVMTIQLFGGYSPFGNRSMLYSDMYHQYYPFFVAFRKAILSGEGLLYSWDIGMGMDYLGLIAYYLASPLNLLSILIPEGWTLGYFSLLVPIKLGLASLFFAIFLKKSFGKDDLSITLFGAFYGLCAWALGYQWNVMWLDTFALLPLVALGTVALLRDKKFFLYTVTLALSIAANYYIGFFTCIFVLLLFFCYEICRFQGFKRFFSDLGRIALFSVIAIGMTAFLTLPAYAALQTTQSSVNAFPSGFRLNIASEHNIKGLLDAMRKVAGNMGACVEHSFKEGLPNVYSGVFAVVLSVLFLSDKQVKLRDKICSVFLLVFFILSCIIRQLDYIWHGFHFTNMIPYRLMFLYSFVLLYMAYRAYLAREQFTVKRIVFATLAAAILIFMSDMRSTQIFLIANLIFLILYMIVLAVGTIQKKPPQKPTKKKIAAYEKYMMQQHLVTSMLLAGVMLLELVINIANFGTNFPYTGASNYPKGTTDTKSVVAVMHELEDDNPFFRAEVTHSQTLNDGALIGYNGISTFTSSANVRVTEFMKTLGYGAKNTYNRYCFEESSPVANLFLGLKYMIERDSVKANAYFDQVYTCGTVTLLENNAYLPLGFLAESRLANVDFSNQTDRFSFQNELLSAASGITDPVWNKLSGSNVLSISGFNSTVSNQSTTGYCSYTTVKGQTSGTVTYSYTADQDGFMCIDLDLSKRNSYTVSVNGTELYSETYSLPQMIAVSDVVAGDLIEVRLKCKEDESGTINIQAAILDDTVFRSAYEVLNASVLELTTFKNTLVEGTVNCDRSGLLYTSIPQNGNWSVQVDGEDAQIVLIGDCMIGVALAQGTHTIRFVYHNSSFSLGLTVSLVCLAVLLALAYQHYKPTFKKGKYEKQ
ncbi:MAG: YfhO family protein [Oscillospiraceae bacterium]|nr:YfhO family protein [Oscillospiraceae bacterium]